MKDLLPKSKIRHFNLPQKKEEKRVGSEVGRSAVKLSVLVTAGQRCANFKSLHQPEESSSFVSFPFPFKSASSIVPVPPDAAAAAMAERLTRFC